MGVPDEKKDREERLAAALRENLRRRKAQARRSAEQAGSKGDGQRDDDGHA